VIKSKKSNALLLIVGGGELELELKKKCKELGIESSVLFLGMRKDVERIIQAMDVFVFPSHFEGLGIAAVEAQAAGLACYFSNTIDSRIKILQTSKILNLNEGANFWANQIIENKNLKNIDISEIVNSEFNIETEVKKIEKILKA